MTAPGAPQRRTRLTVLDIGREPGVQAASVAAFKGVFGRLAQGVTIVTSNDSAGPCGMTASSVSSLSLDPPLALVCLTNQSRTLEAASKSGRFGLSLLRAGHDERSSAFAQPGAAVDCFERFPFEPRAGIPLLQDALAWAICRVEGLVRAGDHTIAVGLVLAAGHDDGEPLVWHRGAYRGLAA